MATKIEITEGELLKIKDFYLKYKLTVKQIAKVMPYSETFITELLKKQNLYINTKYIQKDGFQKSDLKKEVFRLKDELLKKDFSFIPFNIEEKYKSDSEVFIAVCIKTGEYFRDYKNSSGSLTEHIKKIYPNLIHPSNFLKREYKKETGKYWHEQYFNIIKIQNDKPPVKICKYCDWKTVDLENKSGMYMIHLKKHHNLTIEKHLKKHPEDKEYFKKQNLINQKEKEMLSSEENYIICKICNKKLKSLTNTHLKNHNTTLENYKIQFPNEEYHSKNFINKTTSNLADATLRIEKSFVSKPEQSLKDFLKSINLNFDSNNRKLLNGVEIDIINHDKRIGIEFNGNKYHSENYGSKPRSFHLNKTELMNKKNYSLIHIFEDEWFLKNDIVKNKLKHIFKIYEDEVIYARNCIIKEITPDLKNEFLNNYHIQGEDRSNIQIGAYYKEELVTVMTFDNNRQMNINDNKKDEYELKRFCSIDKYFINGIANKLLSYFIKKYNPKKIISFADRRWTLDKDNNLYIKLNFKLVNILGPDYTYFNSKINRLKRYHKFSFGKSSLKRKYPDIYDDNKTEWEMMQELGYDRIWDCGKFKYELDL